MEPSLQPHESHSISRDFKNFILEENHPCIMANTVFQMDKYQLNVYEVLGSRKTADALMTDLKNYIAHYDFESKDFESFIAVFPEAEVVSEIEFENLLWRQLQFLHDMDNSIFSVVALTNVSRSTPSLTPHRGALVSCAAQRQGTD